MRNTTKGWLCVSGGMINLSLSYFSYTLVILFLPLLAEQLGCSLAQASLIFTTSAIASMVASMFLGPIVADHNPVFFCEIKKNLTFICTKISNACFVRK